MFRIRLATTNLVNTECGTVVISVWPTSDVFVGTNVLKSLIKSKFWPYGPLRGFNGGVLNSIKFDPLGIIKISSEKLGDTVMLP